MNKKLRVAVYINGQWRGSSFECSRFLKPYFDQFDVDYYIHTCDYYFGKNLKLDFSKNESTYRFSEMNDVFHSKEDIERIKNTYENVVYFHIDDKKKNEEISNLKPDLSAFYNIYGGYKCNQYRKGYENLNGFKYDCIIKIRPDIIIKKNTENVFKKWVEFISKNPNTFISEHSLPKLEHIESNRDYPIDIFQIGKNFFDDLDKWVELTLEGNNIFLSDIVKTSQIDMSYRTLHLGRPIIYIIRELYKFNNLLELFYNDTLNYDQSIHGYTVCDLDEIIYMENNSRNDKKKFFENWIIDFDSIISKCKKEKNNNVYCLENDGLKILADEIKRNW
jgi:hypothetical protein